MSRHVVTAGALAVTGIVAGNVFLVGPTDRQTRATYQQVADLASLIATAPEQNARLYDLGHTLDELGGQWRNICGPGASGAEREGTGDAIHRAITASGASVRGVRTRAPVPPDGGSRGNGLVAAPLTVDLEGTFEAVFDVLRRLEAMHPVEVASVSIDVLDEETRDRSPMLTATIDFDVLSVLAPLEYPK